MTIEKRKADHLEICAQEDVDGINWWNDFKLIHEALPNGNFDTIDCSVSLLGKTLDYPLIIAAMTGGTKEAMKINKELASLAQEFNIGFGVGSQRIMVTDKKTTKTFAVRDVAPDILLLGNLGLVQFVKDFNTKVVDETAEAIEADAMCIHLNPAHELAQEDGDRNFTGSEDKLHEICRESKTKIIAKETGCGISLETANSLAHAGIDAIDVGGVGGTSWVGVEHYRAKSQAQQDLTKLFWNWGIPTPISVMECVSACDLPVIATGGIRNGIHVVAACTLDAVACGIANPVLRAYMNGGKKSARAYLQKTIKEIKTAMLLSGAEKIEDLEKNDIMILGKSMEWVRQRNLNI